MMIGGDDSLDVSIVVYGHSEQEIFDVVSSLLISCDSTSLNFVKIFIADNKGEFNFTVFKGLVRNIPIKIKYDTSYIRLEKNLGYGVANNRCIKSGSGFFHLVLNPDVIFKRSSMANGIDILKSSSENILVSPKILDSNKNVVSGIKRHPSLLVLILRFFDSSFLNGLFSNRLKRYECRDILEIDRPAYVTIASGCCMLTKKSFLLKSNGFDEKYFLYFEDFDLSLRLSKLGKLVYSPDFKVIHYGGHTGKKGIKHIFYFLNSMNRFFNTYGLKII
ncbi:glycosyltransferase family 2 protein [Parasalinivibrio latis]|uniref:hypothetical protein n=1 Tax=Parasalinivibrio latis TaxID=2952610 RepID=UPI0030E4479F